MFGVEKRPSVGPSVGDDDGDEGGGGDGLSSLAAPLDSRVALAVVQVDGVVPSLGSLHIFSPGDLTRLHLTLTPLTEGLPGTCHPLWPW